MKNATKLVGIIAVAIIAFAIIGCKEVDSPVADTPKVQPDTPKIFTLGTTACKVIIKNDDLFTTAEWNTLCNSVVSAIGRGYNASPGEGMKINIGNFFKTKNISVVLLKNVPIALKVESTDHRTIILKANASTIDGINGENLYDAIITLMKADSSSYP